MACSRFHCYLIDESGAITSRRQLDQEGREAAHRHALGLLPGFSPAVIVEVWEGADLTFRYSRLKTPQTPAELRRLCSLAIAAASTETDIAIKHAVAWGAASLASEAEEIERRALEGYYPGTQNAATT